MDSAHPEVSVPNHQSGSRYRVIWPVLAVIGAFPVVAAMVAVLLLWFVHLWNVPLWLLGVVGFLLTAGATYTVWRATRSLVRRRFQFSLRAMLIAIAVFALILGTVGRALLRFWNQGQAVWQVAESGGYPDNWDRDKEPNWLQTRLGYDPFVDVRAINVRSDLAIPALLEHPEQFAHLEQLNFWGGVTDAGLERVAELNEFPRLRSAGFQSTPLTDEGMRHLGEWTNLRGLFFNSCTFTDDGLAHLKNLPELETLGLLGDRGRTTPITDAGLVHVGKMSRLRTLLLKRVPITDAGVAHLQNLTNLERLIILSTKVTQSGLNELYEALPDCWTRWDNAAFPGVGQIQRISVWEEYPQEKPVVTISERDRIARFKARLEQSVALYQGGWGAASAWGRGWDDVSRVRVRIDLDGRSRCLCRIRLGDGFFQYGSGTYRPMSGSEVRQILDPLGLDAAQWGWNDTGPANSEQAQTPASPDKPDG